MTHIHKPEMTLILVHFIVDAGEFITILGLGNISIFNENDVIPVKPIYYFYLLFELYG